MILGAGIYALIGKGAELARNGLWISFIFGAIITSTTGLSYAELTTMIPREGAEYYYVKNAFNEFFAFLIGWLMLFTQWMSIATIALGFGGYFQGILGVDPVISSMVAIVLLLSLLTFCIEASGLILIIPRIAIHGNRLLYLPFVFRTFSATIIMFFAYLGFEGVEL